MKINEIVTEDSNIDNQIKIAQSYADRARILGDLPQNHEYYLKQVDMLNKIKQNQNKTSSQPQSRSTIAPSPSAPLPAPASTALDNTPMANVASSGDFKMGMSGSAQNPNAAMQYNLDDKNALTGKIGNGTQQIGFQHNFAPDVKGSINMNTNAQGGHSRGISFDKDLGKDRGTLSFGAERGSDGQNRANLGYRLSFEESIDTIKRNAGLI